MAIPQPEDPRAAAVQVELLRRAGPAGRSARARSLSTAVITLARKAIREQMPGASEEEVGLRFVEIHYGAELASRVRAHLERLRR